MNTQTYNINEVRENLPKLVETVNSGQEVIISREGQPVARLSSIEDRHPKIKFGVLKGKIKVSEDFDAQLPQDILSEFE